MGRCWRLRHSAAAAAVRLASLSRPLFVSRLVFLSSCCSVWLTKQLIRHGLMTYVPRIARRLRRSALSDMDSICMLLRSATCLDNSCLCAPLLRGWPKIGAHGRDQTAETRRASAAVFTGGVVNPVQLIDDLECRDRRAWRVSLASLLCGLPDCLGLAETRHHTTLMETPLKIKMSLSAVQSPLNIPWAILGAGLRRKEERQPASILVSCPTSVGAVQLRPRSCFQAT